VGFNHFATIPLYAHLADIAGACFSQGKPRNRLLRVARTVEHAGKVITGAQWQHGHHRPRPDQSAGHFVHRPVTTYRNDDLILVHRTLARQLFGMAGPASQNDFGLRIEFGNPTTDRAIRSGAAAASYRVDQVGKLPQSLAPKCFIR